MVDIDAEEYFDVSAFRQVWLGASAAVVALLVAGTVSGCGSSSGATPVRPSSATIGLLAGGRDATQGAQLAIDIINKDMPGLSLPLAGGTGVLGGTQLNLVVNDPRGDVAIVRQQVTHLVSDEKAVAVIAADSTEVVSAAGQHVEKLGALCLDASSSANDLVELGLEWYFRIGPTDRDYAETTFALIHSQQAVAGASPRAMVLHSTKDVATSTVDTVTAVALRQGYELASTEAINESGTAFEVTSQITRVGPSVVLAVTGSENDASLVAEAANRLRNSVPVIAIGPGVQAVPANSTSRGLLRSTGWSAELAARTPLAKAVADLYQQRFGAAMTEAAARAFTAVLVAAIAVDSAGSVDREKVRTAMRKLWLPATKTIMPWDGIRFDNSGQNQLAAAVVEQGGARGFQVVYPRELAGPAPLAWPGASQG